MRSCCRFPALILFALAMGARLDAAEIPAFTPGPHPVATTNLEVRPQADAKAMFAFLNGEPASGHFRYLTDILVHPEAVPTLQVDVPADAKTYGPYAGQRVPVVLLVVYPTAATNQRPDYVFPYTETGDRTFPRMQRPGEGPLFADPAAKYPLLILSGGYNTHGLWHLFRMKDLAAHGYLVLDLFHGDGRSGSLQANLALRGLALRRALDFLLADPAFGPAIDAGRIGVIGESAGAHTVLAALGGIDPSGRMPPAADPRIKAAVGLVPFLGTSFGFWPFTVDAWHFGEDYAGLSKVTRPFLALYGGRDTSVPPERVEAGVRALAGPTIAVRLDEEGHLLSDPAQRDARAWERLFFDAWLRDDAAARQLLDRADAAPGGAPDRVTYRRSSAAPAR